MITTNQGTIINKVVAVDNSIAKPNHIAFQDIDGAILHINVDDVIKLAAHYQSNKQTEANPTNFFTS